jgi:hypothetical protein
MQGAAAKVKLDDIAVASTKFIRKTGCRGAPRGGNDLAGSESVYTKVHY